jgi:hypothetical protein
VIRRLAAAALLLNIAAMAAVREIESSWANLNLLIVSKRIALVLPSGASVEGTVGELQPEGLVMMVAKTSDAQANPKGKATIPRASVSTIQLLEMRPTYRIIGTVLGVAVGLAVAVGIAVTNGFFAQTTKGQAVGETAAIVGFPVLGFLLGRSLDRKVTRITVTH